MTVAGRLAALGITLPKLSPPCLPSARVPWASAVPGSPRDKAGSRYFIMFCPPFDMSLGFPDRGRKAGDGSWQEASAQQSAEAGNGARLPDQRQSVPERGLIGGNHGQSRHLLKRDDCIKGA